MAVTHSEYFQKYYDRYQRRGCRLDQLKQLVDLNALTKDEFLEITGVTYDDYVASVAK